jgi:hypothetical protein
MPVLKVVIAGHLGLHQPTLDANSLGMVPVRFSYVRKQMSKDTGRGGAEGLPRAGALSPTIKPASFLEFVAPAIISDRFKAQKIGEKCQVGVNCASG